MSAHHDHHHVIEKKPVAFTVPFILAAVLIFIIVLLVNVCDPGSHNKPHDGKVHSGASSHSNDHDGDVHATDEGQQPMGKPVGNEPAGPEEDHTGSEHH
jgi:hypothetical protein